jgi:hypothetical protein
MRFALLVLLALAFSSCEVFEGIRQSNNKSPVGLQCDRAKQIDDWIPWEAEVRRILCEQANACGDPDEGAGYGFTTRLYHEGYTPCRAAERIIKTVKA